MDELLDQLLALTENAVDHLDRMTFQELAEWVQAREEIIAQIRRQPAEQFRGEERRRKVEQLLSQSPALVARMEELRAEAALHLNKVGKARMQKDVYDSAYTPDSFFIDKRK